VKGRTTEPEVSNKILLHLVSTPCSSALLLALRRFTCEKEDLTVRKGEGKRRVCSAIEYAMESKQTQGESRGFMMSEEEERKRKITNQK
jgi:hypothetical protein